MANQITSVPGGARYFGVLPSAARTASPDTFEFDGFGRNALGVIVVLDVTAVGAGPALTVSIQLVDRLSGKTVELLKNTAAIATTGTRIFRVRPDITAVNADPSFAAADVLPPVFRVAVTHGNAISATYSLSAHLTN